MSSFAHAVSRNSLHLAAVLVLGLLPVRAQELPEPQEPEAPLMSPDQGYAGFTLAFVQSRAATGATGEKHTFNTGSFSVFYGWKPGRTWGVQAGLGVFGEFPKGDGTTTWHRNVQDGTLEGLGWFPLGPKASFTVKAGLAVWTASWGNGGQGANNPPGSTRTSGLTPLAGIGLDLQLWRHWTLRLEGEGLLKVLDAPVTRVGAGLLYQF